MDYDLYDRIRYKLSPTSDVRIATIMEVDPDGLSGYWVRDFIEPKRKLEFIVASCVIGFDPEPEILLTKLIML